LDVSPSRRTRIVSVLSVAVAIFAMAGLYFVMRVSGGELFNPGPLSAKGEPGIVIQEYKSHADFEANCTLCHQPLKKSMAESCLACHSAVADQISAKMGVHAKLSDVNNCASCHGEHKGRDFDPLQTALVNFDHSKTAFPLRDQHAQAACKDCHQNNRFDQADPKCVSCHSEPALHAGLFGSDCASCHTSSKWTPALVNNQPFNHELLSFSLAKHAKNYQGQALVCADCHTKLISTAFDPVVCSSCHAKQNADFMQKHIAQYGADCTQCHDGTDRMHGFQHAQVFVLDGKHAALACDACHANQKFHATPAECSACHKEPDIHAGAFGLKCQYCHTTDAWRPALLKAHGFPLDHGGKGAATCQTCHSGAYNQYTCYTCHDHQQDEIEKTHARINIPVAKLSDCVACHMDGKVHP
jgi:hypothetical protein